VYQDSKLFLNQAVIKDWEEHYAEVFGKHILLLQHSLHELPIFREENLERLIEGCPTKYYDFVKMGKQGEHKKSWRRGSIKDVKGSDVLSAIEKGRFWLSLQSLQEWDDTLKAVVDHIFDDFSEKVPGFKPYKLKLGMLISSPNAQVYYHCDLPAQSLWQIKGEKDVYIYPNSEPFLSDQELEPIFLGKSEEEISFQPWYDQFASKTTLKPGEMTHWPLNGPHRVENHDCMNISVTTSHFTDEVRNFYAQTYANGLLREMGFNPKRNSAGLTKYSKIALAAGHKFVYNKFFAKPKSPKAPMDFTVDLSASDLMKNIEPISM